MKIFLNFSLALCLFSCHIQQKASMPLAKYRDWKPYASKVFSEALRDVCKKWPKEWNKCPDGVSEWAEIDSIDIAHDITILDALKEANGITGDQTCKLAVIHQFNNGFNSWYCEIFLIKVGKKWKGLEICRAASPGSLEDLMDDTPIEKAVVFTQDELNYFFKLKAGTFAFNGDTKIITCLNERYEITGFHLVLYP